MHQTLLLEITGNIATITLNRPEKRNAISTPMMAELQTALDEIEPKPRTRGDSDRSGQSILRRHGFGYACVHREAVPGGKSGGFAADCQNVSPHLEFPATADRSGQRRGVCRRLRYRHALRFHAGRAGSQIRVHRSEDWISASDCFCFLTRQIGESARAIYCSPAASSKRQRQKNLVSCQRLFLQTN